MTEDSYNEVLTMLISSVSFQTRSFSNEIINKLRCLTYMNKNKNIQNNFPFFFLPIIDRFFLCFNLRHIMSVDLISRVQILKAKYKFNVLIKLILFFDAVYILFDIFI